ncbi:adhesin/invasin [Orbus hercynius]|uniref:Adhesin/invasin n=1 Tax=Orbus hercynius TaxID=593135 RepID=A0A495RBM8_9GAMM|nr:inverse autotransporter beta domain-containing protein [Orbus hercynius]RKS84731.1 adhesin/invasin [Orbus hercynius]
MKKSLNLSMVATLVLVALSCHVAKAQVSRSLPVKNENAKLSQADNLKVFINNQQRSLYQIALLSNISVSELRDLNKGSYDDTDIVKVGDSINLPADSPLLPAESKKTKENSKYSYLPSLGSSDKASAEKNDNALDTQVASVLQTLGQQDWDHMSSQQLKDDLNTKTQNYAESYVRNQVNNQVIDPIRSAAQDFLGRFGTAQLQFDVSDQAKLNNVNVKLFSPWYDSDSTLIFSQLTYQEYEKDRRIGNFGIGQRWDLADKNWLVGYNVFFDHDFSRNHNRLGLGLEAWTDYMKFAANYYTPLSDWKDSKDFDDYLERAARGYDLRFQGYLPSYPHLGASLMFEQYFGDKVALFGKDNLQKDPYALTLGIDYTPVPLFTIKGEHKQGESSNKMAKVELTMNYRLGVPLKDQLDPNMVDVARSLKGSRYDLVDRNNYIVLEYKEKKFSVDLASLGFVEEHSVIDLGIAVHNAKDGITISPSSWNNVTGTADLMALSAAGADGNLCYNRVGLTCSANNVWNVAQTSDTNNWSILVPSYINSITGERNPTASSGVAVPGRYTLDVTLTDGKGRTAVSNQSWLAIKPSSTRQVLLTNVTPNPAGGDALGSASAPAAANGRTSVFLQANLVSSPVTVSPATGLPIPTGQVAGFSDYFTFAEYPVPVPAAPLTVGSVYEAEPPTAEEIAKINSLYTATSGGNKVTFVATNAANQCPTETPKCLLVKSIKKVVGSASISDDYLLELSTNATLSSVDVSLKFSTYSASSPVYGSGSAPTTIYFNGGVPSKITISNGNTVVGVVNDDRTITMTGKLVVGDTYTVKVEDSLDNDVTSSSNIVWSLVGDNISACAGANVILPGNTNPNGDDQSGALAVSKLFNISNTSVYQIKGLTVSNASYAGLVAGATTGGTATSINNNTVAAIALGGLKTSSACAGDQGFKLRIDVN